MSTPFSAAEAQAARDYAAANAKIPPPTLTTSTSTAASLARAFSSAATAIAGDISLVAEGIEAAGEGEEAAEERPSSSAKRAEEEPKADKAKKAKTSTSTSPSTATRDQLSFLVGVLVFGMSAFYLGAYTFYFLWAVPYGLYMFVFAKERIRERQYETLYTYQTRNPNSPMSRAIAKFPPKLSALVYMGVHLLATTIALSTTYLWWRSYAAHSLALVAAVGVSAWHGASFLHYVLRRARREAAAEAAAEAASAAAAAAACARAAAGGGDKDD